MQKEKNKKKSRGGNDEKRLIQRMYFMILANY